MEETTNQSNAKETSRLEAFSDGVFAIAITLLVLELITTLHAENGSGLIQTCLDHWQSFLAFTIGFVTIMVCWVNHHVAFDYIKKIDTKLIWINGFLLFVVTLTPFPTAILAEYLAKEGTTALAFFGFNYILISVAADSICTYAYNHHLIAETNREYYYSYKLIYRYALFYVLIAFAICFISVVAAITMYTLLFAVFAAPKEFASRVHKIRERKRKNRIKRRKQ
ncbi:MAG: TMEM175 family protein [Bacteroidota bacterium]|nr:TMEM175 family protein [Bacteroidota bacterium]